MAQTETAPLTPQEGAMVATSGGGKAPLDQQRLADILKELPRSKAGAVRAAAVSAAVRVMLQFMACVP